ncbi:prolactin-8A9-like [Arvicanthis niloticus]|uniref:prolactin-8A9-like n=1 Tax=Arvicanthis niloticus TaxID=61156 RepID=UPI0014870925|nr:prolactin-8A9-like [Arvicanthis niloticus]
MKLPLSQPHFCSFLLLVVLNFLLWEKAASVPACIRDEHCLKPVVATFNNALQRAVTIHNLTEQMYLQFFVSKFSSGYFVAFSSQLTMLDHLIIKATSYCHSTITNPPNIGREFIQFKSKRYLKMLINFVGAWIIPLNRLVFELRVIKDVSETIHSIANEIERNNKLLLDDLKWIFTKVYPKGRLEEMFPRWEFLSLIKSKDKFYQLLAIFNLSNCLRKDIYYTEFHIKTLKCRITNEGCC